MATYEQLHDRLWLLREYVDKQRDVHDIARELGCHRTTVQSWLNRHDIPQRNPAPPRYPALDDADWLEHQYVTRQLGLAEIADRLGCTTEAVRDALERHKIEPRTPPSPRYPELDDADWLREQHVERQRSVAEIAAGLGSSPEAVSRALTRHKIRQKQGRPRELSDRDWLVRRYVDERAGTADIARELGCTDRAVRGALVRHSIPRRPRGLENPELTDREWLRERYVVQRRSAADISRELGCAEGTVYAWVTRHRLGRS